MSKVKARHNGRVLPKTGSYKVKTGPEPSGKVLRGALKSGTGQPGTKMKA